MKQIHIKNRLYILPALLFCMNLQSTETTQSNTTHPDTQTETQVALNHDNQVNQNTLDAFNLAVIHKKYDNPKPHNIGSQNNVEWQNIAESYHNPKLQNIDGSPDNSFGPNGRGYTVNQFGTSSQARAVITLPHNNEIVVGGERENKAVLIQYTNNSELNRAFGGVSSAGVVVNNNGITAFNTIAIQKNRRIIAAGREVNQFALTRYYEDGNLDTDFGNNGKADIQNQGGEITAIALQGDNIIVSGNDNSGAMVLARFNSDGILDRNFAPTFHSPKPGIRITRIGAEARAHALAIQQDNKIVVVGSGNQTQMAIVRYTENGELDTTFGPDNTGIVTIIIGNEASPAYGVVIQKDEKIVVVGQSHHLGDGAAVFTTVRLNADGSLDTSFGNQGGGVVTTRPQGTPYPAFARSVALDEDEKIIVMGYVNVDTISYFTLLRYNTYGVLDTTFGVNGIQITGVTINGPNRSTLPVVGTLQNDKEKLVLAGNYVNAINATNNQIAVARYLATH